VVNTIAKIRKIAMMGMRINLNVLVFIFSFFSLLMDILLHNCVLCRGPGGVSPCGDPDHLTEASISKRFFDMLVDFVTGHFHYVAGKTPRRHCADEVFS
jgi:hypothetical protein